MCRYKGDLANTDESSVPVDDTFWRRQLVKKTVIKGTGEKKRVISFHCKIYHLLRQFLNSYHFLPVWKAHKLMPALTVAIFNYRWKNVMKRIKFRPKWEGCNTIASSLWIELFWLHCVCWNQRCPWLKQLHNVFDIVNPL